MNSGAEMLAFLTGLNVLAPDRVAQVIVTLAATGATTPNALMQVCALDNAASTLHAAGLPILEAAAVVGACRAHAAGADDVKRKRAKTAGRAVELDFEMANVTLGVTNVHVDMPLWKLTDTGLALVKRGGNEKQRFGKLLEMLATCTGSINAALTRLVLFYGPVAAWPVHMHHFSAHVIYVVGQVLRSVDLVNLSITGVLAGVCGIKDAVDVIKTHQNNVRANNLIIAPPASVVQIALRHKAFQEAAAAVLKRCEKDLDTLFEIVAYENQSYLQLGTGKLASAAAKMLGMGVLGSVRTGTTSTTARTLTLQPPQLIVQYQCDGVLELDGDQFGYRAILEQVGATAREQLERVGDGAQLFGFEAWCHWLDKTGRAPAVFAAVRAERKDQIARPWSLRMLEITGSRAVPLKDRAFDRIVSDDFLRLQAGRNGQRDEAARVDAALLAPLDAAGAGDEHGDVGVADTAFGDAFEEMCNENE